MDRNYDVITFISKYLYFKKASRVASFSDIIKNASMFIKATFEDSKKCLKNYKLCIKI